MNKPPFWYWLLSAAALLWAGAGCAAYLMQVSMGEADLATLPAEQAAIWRMMPVWVIGAYAVAVWSGLAGALCLLIRSRHARTAYLVSLIGVLVQFGWSFLATPLLSTVGPSAATLPVIVAMTTIGLIWFGGYAARRGWLR